jgi:hypothetical protein
MEGRAVIHPVGHVFGWGEAQISAHNEFNTLSDRLSQNFFGTDW